MRSAIRCAIAGLAVVLGAAACTSSSSDDEPQQGAQVASAVQIDALMAHLENLDRIAKDNDGNRAAGKPGYDASVAYVTDKLKEKGFEVSTPEFEINTFDLKSESLTVGDQQVKVATFGYSPGTEKAGLVTRVVEVPVDDTPGCEASDYDNLDVTGAIVIVRRGICPFAAKQQIAAERGAAALLVAFVGEQVGGGTLGSRDVAKIPTAGIGVGDVPALVAPGANVKLLIDADATTFTTRNIIAQTKTGSADNVVMVGAHLDSVPDGPGINDNGSGSAAILETALQMGSEPDVQNAVRFAWWGGEELGLLGSTDYVSKLSSDERLKIALYLNYDMIASPNPAYLTYDGDDSDKTGEPAGPDGSAAIERMLNAYLLNQGITPEGTDFDGRSDYGPFIEHKIPSGGIFTGAEDKMSADQAQKWGGEADEPFDANYHASGDTLANIDRDAFARNGAAVAYSVETYAQSIDGPNGVPSRADREAARGDEK